MSSHPVSSSPYRLQEAAPGSFIYVIDKAIEARTCQRMVELFEQYEDQQVQGKVGAEQQVIDTIKRSTDIYISGRPQWQEIDQCLHQSLYGALTEMAKQHPFFSATRLKDSGYNVQRTNKGEYYHWHVDEGAGPLSQRVLVALWYLNDVPGPGGATEFSFQNLSIQPEQGRLILFPPYWTHVHRNSLLQSGVKYIATTWLNYAEA